MSHRATTEEEYIFFAADHASIASAFHAELFETDMPLSQSIETRIDHEVEEYGQLHIETFADMANDLFDDDAEKNNFFAGTVLSLSVLDKAAQRLEVEPVRYRRCWIARHIAQSQLRHLKAIDEEYDKLEDYHQLILRIVEALSQTQDERDAFFIGFSLMLRTGREAIVAMKLMDVAKQADDIIEGTNIEAELASILGKE